MTQEFIKELQDKFLGKRIRVPWNSAYSYRDSDTVTGICTFIGINEHFPSWNLQVTVDRLPLTNVDHTKIELL